MDPEWKELLEEIKRNNAVQEDLNKKWRQERGLPDPEPTELQLMFQRWVRSAEAPLSPVPEGEAPLSPLFAEPRGEEPPLPEPRKEVKKIPPPQPRPPPLKTSLAPDGAVPCPDIVVPLPECQDLPPLVLTPRSQHCRAQLLAWSPTPLLLNLQTSRREGQMSRALPLSLTLFPLKLQASLRGSAVAHLCLSLLAPGCRPALQSPWSSRPGSLSLVRGPFQEMPEGPTHPQARPQEGAKIDICGLEDKDQISDDMRPSVVENEAGGVQKPDLTESPDMGSNSDVWQQPSDVWVLRKSGAGNQGQSCGQCCRLLGSRSSTGRSRKTGRVSRSKGRGTGRSGAGLDRRGGGRGCGGGMLFASSPLGSGSGGFSPLGSGSRGSSPLGSRSGGSSSSLSGSGDCGAALACSHSWIYRSNSVGSRFCLFSGANPISLPHLSNLAVCSF
ncbi:UNVERIFIED_CONTAM: hypothetical protein FKN15_073123 [Acipenser sinensis]